MAETADRAAVDVGKILDCDVLPGQALSPSTCRVAVRDSHTGKLSALAAPTRVSEDCTDRRQPPRTDLRKSGTLVLLELGTRWSQRWDGAVVQRTGLCSYRGALVEADDESVA